MAKNKSAGSGIVIIGLIVLAMAAKYWYLFVTLGIAALVIWGIAKLVKNRATSEIPHTTQPSSSSPSQPIRSNIAMIEANTQQTQSASPDALWMPCGRTIQHADYSIPGGLIYFGSGLKSVQRWSEEPSLIDPSLPVFSDNPDREGQNMGYWPSYTQIHPTSRAAYLEWLSTGRKDAKANIGYVFIYFYGLERRALADAMDSASARNDLPAIITEVKRLLSIYGENGSFHGYASKFLDALQVSQTTEPLYRTSPRIASCSWEVPLTLKVALGQMATNSVPLSAEWALAWAENDPSMPRRMPVQRCPEEFRELFRLRYNEKFGEGLKLKPNKARIQATYRPASSSFGGGVEIPMPDLPDITQITGPSSKIINIITECTDELEGYSRYLGRNPDGKNSIEATSYLPHLLLQKHAGKEFQGLSNWLNDSVTSDGFMSVSFSTVLQQAPSINRDGFGKKEATAIANLLGKMNIGIEPDPRFGNFIPKPEQDIVLFRISDNAPNSPSAEYSAATVVLHLASAVASADGSVDPTEERHLEGHLEAWLHLAPHEKMRLRAHTQWLLSSFPGMNGVKKRIELLKQDQRESLGRFLVGIAQADGYIDPAEMKMLTKIYEMLGLDTQSLYSHAHAAAVEPVTVQTVDFVRPQGYAIPSPPTKPTEGISLDMSCIEAKLAETVAVSAILNNIFTEEEPAQPTTPVSEPVILNASITGLDPESFAFMRVLASKLTWAREELEKLAADHNLMLDGTLDSINDASFDHFGEPFFEGNDPIEIDPEIVNRLESFGPG
jgi:tellurite resistance protein